MKLRDKSATPSRVYYVVTSGARRAALPTQAAAIRFYRDMMRDGFAPIRLDRFRLDARHLDGLLTHGIDYFGQLTPEVALREYENRWPAL